MIPFAKYPQKDLVDMAAEAARLALEDAAVKPQKVELGIFANALAGMLFGDSTIGQNVFWEVGINRIPIINVENACTSGSTAFHLGVNAIAAGQVEVAMVVGAEKMCVPQIGLLNSGNSEIDSQLGLVAPASFALRAKRYMHEFGVDERQLAAVAVKNRKHAQANPYAFYRKPLSLDEVLASPMIVDPLTRLQCCPIADGAAAIIIADSKTAKSLGGGVRVDATILASGSYENPQDCCRWETDFRSAAQAYEMAGIGPQNLDLVECHDAFTIAEILHYEALGLCAVGEGARFVVSGEASLHGKIPVNVSGGLLNRGHPVAATGVAQLIELVWQLRGQAGDRQVNNAKVGLAHCMGGDKASDTKSCTISILSV
jgi:acetyl-CoA acetyltransferase